MKCSNSKFRTLSFADKLDMTLVTLVLPCQMNWGTKQQLPVFIHANSLRFTDTIVSEPRSPLAKRLCRTELFGGEKVEFKVRGMSFGARVDIVEERTGFVWLTPVERLWSLAVTLEEAAMTRRWR
jgi:hypothetical protein